jgi:hypothetical protein
MKKLVHLLSVCSRQDSLASPRLLNKARRRAPRRRRPAHRAVRGVALVSSSGDCRSHGL